MKMPRITRWFALHVLVTACLSCLLSRAAAQDDKLSKFIAQTPPRTGEEQQKMFHLPPGFRIELVACEPDVIKPINMNFDAAGNLLVSQSVEYPFPAPSDRKGRDTIKRIADTNGDGVPDRVTTFADGLSIPIGVTPVADGVIGYSIPNIFHFPDADHDGRADSKQALYTEFGHRDTHGMANNLSWWIDGWVYGCHGFSNTSTVKGADDKPIVMNSGNTYRIRPDGSHIEYFTHGQVNPFGIAFDALGNIFTSDCHTLPLYMLVRGAYYPSFGKPHDGLGFGPKMMQHNHGSTGIAGNVYCTSNRFPDEYRDTLFIGNPITGRINHDRLQQRGSTFKAIEQPDFISCDDPWFRPVDLQFALDGSLYIADFYNRIIGHYEVPLTHPLRDKERGRIWRVVYVGNDPKDSPAANPIDLTKVSKAELIAELGNDDLVIRTHATHQLVHRIGLAATSDVKTLLAGESSPEQRSHSLWVLERLGALDDDMLRRLADDSDRLVRVHVVKMLAERSPWNDEYRSMVSRGLSDADPFVRRASADALGRHPHASHIGPLLELWKATSPEDELLVHTIRIALRDTIAQLKSLPLLADEFDDSADVMSRLVDLSLGIRSKQAADFLLGYHESHRPAADQAGRALRHIARYAPQSSLSRLYKLAASYKGKPVNVQRDVLLDLNRAIRERGARFPDSVQAWSTKVANDFLASNDPQLVRAGIDFAQEVRPKGVGEKLAELVSDGSRPQPIRSQAVDALVKVEPERALDIIDKLLNDPKTKTGFGRRLAKALGSLNTPQSRQILLELFVIAPEDLALTAARGLANTREGAEALLVAVEKGHASARLLQDSVVSPRVLILGVRNAQQRVEKQLEGLPPGDERLRKSIAKHKAGFTKSKSTASLGAAVFKKNCAACHQIAGQGNKVGPELDGVGLRGADRLLEDILDPNRNVDANFRASVIATDDGQVFNGLVLREEGKVLICVDDKGKEHRIPLAEIEERRLMKLSPMPANVRELVKEDEFYNLLAYLLEQRRKVEPRAEPEDK